MRIAVEIKAEVRLVGGWEQFSLVCIKWLPYFEPRIRASRWFWKGQHSAISGRNLLVPVFSRPVQKQSVLS